MTQEIHDAIDEQVARATVSHKHELAEAASSAAKTIAEAASSAVKAVADAAASASSLLVHNAEESAKGLIVQRSSDHDAIVRISEKIDSLKEDVRALKDGTANRIEKLECEKLNIRDGYANMYKKADDDFKAEMYNRIKQLEEGHAQVRMLGIAAFAFLGILQFVIDKFVIR